MPKLPLSKEQKIKVEDYLKTYLTSKKLLRMEKYHNEYMHNYTYEDFDSTDREILDETPLARAKMFGVRHFILGLDNSDEKLFLYYHYIKNESVERCGELLGISRRTAYRLKEKALSLAYVNMYEK